MCQWLLDKFLLQVGSLGYCVEFSRYSVLQGRVNFIMRVYGVIRFFQIGFILNWRIVVKVSFIKENNLEVSFNLCLLFFLFFYKQLQYITELFFVIGGLESLVFGIFEFEGGVYTIFSIIGGVIFGINFCVLDRGS